MIEASIVIPTYNRKSILEKCLEALFNQNYPNDKYEIVLINDGSTDETDKMVASLDPPCRLRYVRNNKRLGVPKSRNRGIRLARGKYIICVDSDIIVVPEFAQEHLKYHRLYGDGIVNGELIYISSLEQVGKKRKGVWDISFSSFNTANVSVTKKHIDKVGGFDVDLLPYGWQDVELGYRLKKIGLKSRKNPEALGYHFRKWADTSNLDFLKEKELMRGMSGALYFKKHPCFKVKASVKGNPLFGLAFIGRWLDKNPGGKRVFSRLQNRDIEWLNAALIKLVLCHYYLQGYHQEMNK
ncbi:glycosyltransferase [Candidatus Aerophobetes bacterium]|nr:glycosyltransferase [Candidatus Aerophobetes bacterium]